MHELFEYSHMLSSNCCLHADKKLTTFSNLFVHSKLSHDQFEESNSQRSASRERKMRTPELEAACPFFLGPLPLPLRQVFCTHALSASLPKPNVGHKYLCWQNLARNSCWYRCCHYCCIQGAKRSNSGQLGAVTLCPVIASLRPFLCLSKTSRFAVTAISGHESIVLFQHRNTSFFFCDKHSVMWNALATRFR